MKNVNYAKFLILILCLTTMLLFYQRVIFLIDNNVENEESDFDQNLRVDFRSMTLHIGDFVEKSLNLRGQNPNNLIYVTLINEAFLEFTLNWLCNTKNMHGVHENTLIACTDLSSVQKLQVIWPKIKAVLIRMENNSLHYSFSDSLTWGQPDYVSFMALRARLISVLVTNGIKFVLFETDAVWTKDAHEFLQSQIRNSMGSVDILTPKKYEPDFFNRSLCFSPLLVLETGPKVSRFFGHMADLLADNQSLYDQDILDDLCKFRYENVRCRFLDYKNVADGYWFYLPDKFKKLYFEKPSIINNNFIIGLKHKITRQALHGYWFLDVRKKYECDEVLLQKSNIWKK
uniref:Nucleotide-diphospho-sugar transferase domain-containing protein n=1 Tax=Romanomermis culicivorax TaxID=13658 RepID=A0A915JLK2_ROMCU